MKNKIVIILAIILTVANSAFSQIVSIPDPNFKAALINHFPNIDTNDDGEIQVSEAEAMTLINVEFDNIVDLTGIEAFTNVITLQVRNNDIVSLDLSNNTSVIDLDCSNNAITSLNLGNNPNLEELHCNGNLLTSIDLSSVINLEELSIHNNDLMSLDLSNSPNLFNLSAYNNELTSINLNGVTALEYLSLGSNLLTSLDLSTNINLRNVTCSNNQLSSVTFGNSAQLTDVTLNDNLLQTIDITSLPTLQDFFIQNNQLTGINITTNTILDRLYISGNQITDLNTIINSTSSVTFLRADNNLLETVDLSNNSSIIWLYLNDNLLTDFIANDTVERVELKNNQFITIDLSDDYENLDRIVLNDNTNLTYINIKNGNNSSYLFISVIDAYDNLDNLEAVCVDDINSDFAGWIQQQNNQPIVFTEYCSFTPGGTFYTVEGNTTFDADNNGCDISDTAIPNVKLNITNGTLEDSFYSDSTGVYTMPIQAGNYTITPELENSTYYNITPSSINVDFPNDPDPVIQDFCLTANGVHNDLDIIIVPMQDARPGFDIPYKLIYKNKGNTTISGSIDFTYNDDYTSYIFASPNPNTESSGSLSWNFTDLNPFESREIDFELNLNPPTDPNFPLNSGDMLVYNATIFPTTNDETPEDNTITLNQDVVNSFDPNDKTCLEGATITPEEVGAYVHYLIRFENTGTANAINVVIKDNIDLSKYDISSLVPLRASHNFVTRISNDNEVEFIFENIQLPFDDANNDGYVLFKIKTLPTLTLGDSFSNEAEIYFDFNFPIITNNETTTVAENLNTEEFSLTDETLLIPNPTRAYFTLKAIENLNFDNIELYDLAGKKLLRLPKQDTYYVGDLKTGIYFVSINTSNQNIVMKLIKQ
ncbi:MAG: T9SS type A sorting domain-containing protein [Bacteroidota bacterium]